VTRLAVGINGLPVAQRFLVRHPLIARNDMRGHQSPEGPIPQQAASDARQSRKPLICYSRTMVSLSPGDWIVQNAANSKRRPVWLIRFAREMGLHTLASCNSLRRREGMWWMR